MKENTSFNSKQLASRFCIEYIVGIVIALLTILLSETAILPLEGSLVGNANLMYILEVGCILLTIALVPGALKGYHWAISHKAGQKEGLQRLQFYIRWNEIRQWVLWFVMEGAIILYYATLENTGMYCALIAFIATLYCWPSKDGLQAEWDALPKVSTVN